METSRVSTSGEQRRKPHRMLRHAAVARRHASRLDPAVRGLIWTIAAGITFTMLNTLMKSLVLEVGAFQTQFLRYVFGFVAMLPLVLRAGVRTYLPRNFAGHFVRGGVHTAGLVLWFVSISHVTIADATAITFTGPIFIMIGAAWMFGERMRWERWVAAAIGLAGVLIVVAPKLTGSGGAYTLLMLASSPIFAVSVLITKGLSRSERAEVIVVWQAISIALLSLPLAALQWTMPTAMQWLSFLACGLLGSLGHYMLTHSYSVIDVSATQSVKFLDLVWATLLGWLVFGDLPSQFTLIGGTVICASTLWIAQREARTFGRS